MATPRPVTMAQVRKEIGDAIKEIKDSGITGLESRVEELEKCMLHPLLSDDNPTVTHVDGGVILSSIVDKSTFKLSPARPGMRYALTEEAKSLGVQFKEPNEGDAGYDLYAVINESYLAVMPGTVSKRISTGVCVEIPPGYVGIVKDRSSMAAQGWSIPGGVIDSSYRGEIQLIFNNSYHDTLKITPGQKVAQLLIVPCITPVLEQVPQAELGKTKRGDAGFGSTGV